MAEKTRAEIEKQAIVKAWKEESFKKDLMKKPHQALMQIGVNVPESIEIRVVEESPKVLYLVLPINPEESGELTDDALEAVAGGFACKGFCAID